MVFYLTYYIPSEYAYILSVPSTDDAKWQCSKMFTKLGSEKDDFVKEQSRATKTIRKNRFNDSLVKDF